MNTLIWILFVGVGLWWLSRAMSRYAGNGGGHGHHMGGGCCGSHSHHRSQREADEKQRLTRTPAEKRQIREMVVDPVCQMAVEPEKAAHSLLYSGKTFYFCSDSCYNTFKNDPEGYLVSRLAAR